MLIQSSMMKKEAEEGNLSYFAEILHRNKKQQNLIAAGSILNCFLMFVLLKIVWKRF